MLGARLFSLARAPGPKAQQSLSLISSQHNRRYCKKLPENDEIILENFVNRNPRNMELLRIERKPQGHDLDTPTISYYYRLMLKRGKRCLSGWVEHNTGAKVIFASTNEWAIRRHLYSGVDMAASKNLGKILARRCLQAGIYEMHTELEQLKETSSRVKLFLEAMQSEGITLGEVEHIREKHTYPSCYYDITLPWEVREEEVDRLKESDMVLDELVPR